MIKYVLILLLFTSCSGAHLVYVPQGGYESQLDQWEYEREQRYEQWQRQQIIYNQQQFKYNEYRRNNH